MGLQRISVRLLWFWFLLLALVSICHVTSGANEKDKEECAEQLAGLATCLPYVGGNAKSPTPDCCSGLKQVLNTNKKCLCVVVKDRNDPDLGLTINVTLALGLPTVCHTPANITKCPELLHLAPNSTDAQVFYQYGHSSSGGASASSPTASANASTAGGVEASTKRPSGSTTGTGTTWLKREMIPVGVVSCILTLTFVM